MMRGIVKNIAFRIFHPLFRWYTSAPRKCKYKETEVIVYPEVFYPKWVHSTYFLLDYLETEGISNKKLLELGAGNGLISLHSAARGALVTAVDISKTAIEGLKKNARRLKQNIEIIESDLFEKVNTTKFDYIIINPPYYPKNPTTEAEMAWYCGSGFEYFKALFHQMSKYCNSTTKVVMVLSQDCAIETIEEIASYNGWELVLEEKRKSWWEENFIFRIKQVNKG